MEQQKLKENLIDEYISILIYLEQSRTVVDGFDI